MLSMQSLGIIIPKMSDDKKTENIMPSMKKRVALANFALHGNPKSNIEPVFKKGEEGSEILLECKCPKCTHEITTEDKRFKIKKGNANPQNSGFQHLWSIGAVEFSYFGNPFVRDLNKMGWCPEKGWYSNEQLEKVGPAKSQQKLADGSKPSASTVSGKAVAKSTNVTNGKSYASVLETTVEDATVEDATVEDATVEDATVEDATVEDATVEDATVEDATLPEVYFCPILTTNTSVTGEHVTEVSFIPVLIQSVEGITNFLPCNTLPDKYTSIKTPIDEAKNLWFAPVVVFDDDLKQVIRFQPKIHKDNEGIYKVLMGC